MAAGGGVEVEGLARLQATLAQFARDVDDFHTAHERAGKLVATKASSTAPKRTGRLSASDQVKGYPSEAVVRWGVRYAAPIQWGVGPRPGRRGPHNIRATRFATKAAEQSRPRIIVIYEQALDQKLSKVKGQ